MATPPRAPVPERCTSVSPECPVEWTIYGYAPDLGANAFFAGFFGVAFILQLIFGIKYKTWTYMIGVGLGCLAECIGYIGRIIMHNNAYNNNGFIIQVVLLIFAPAFLAAGIYLTLKHVVIQFGEQWSRVRPAWYTYIFITCDITSLLMQSAGGALAATAGPGAKAADIGTDLMIAGIVWQVIILVFFGLLVAEYSWRTYKRRNQLSQSALKLWSTTRFKCFCGAVFAAYTFIFMRCVYRIPELLAGWGKGLMRNELDFIILEGLMIVLAVLAQTAFHPGIFFPVLTHQRNKATEETEMEPLSRYENVSAPVGYDQMRYNAK